jgi:hypothetical protein
MEMIYIIMEKRNLVEHPTYAIEVFETKFATLTTKGKGEP